MTTSSNKELTKWRNEFLLRLYDDLWRSIDRMESGMWQFVALYAVVAGLMISAASTQAPRSVIVVFSLIVTFWGINIAINAGKWFRRNLAFAVNIEQQFLFHDDIGRILPAAYHQRKPKLLNILYITHITHIIIFSTTAIVSLYFFWSDVPWSIVAPLIVVGGIVTVLHYAISTKEVRDFIANTSPDRPPQDPVKGSGT